MLRTKRQTSPEERRTNELIREYEELTARLEQIRSCYDLAEENAVIDALIYEENAVQCRLSALTLKARETGVHVEHFQRRKI
ncbi:MAG: hypothetical protein MR291_06180 [Oscillospiraceae bacterium]|nr:hypothetical protein [Oscillospiraceae bacterium]MDY4587500.1 hypothetical protein [Oscillospiraceae bacterium]